MTDLALSLMVCTFMFCFTLTVWHGCEVDHQETMRCFDKGGIAFTGSHCHFKDEDKKSEQ